MTRRFGIVGYAVGITLGFGLGAVVGIGYEAETSQRAIVALGECVATAEYALDALQGADDAIHDRMAPPLPALGATDEP